MHLLSRFQQAFGFTRNEIKVVLLLSLTFFIGLGIRWYKSVHPAVTDAGHFDYSESDRQFLERSRRAADLLAQANRVPDERPGKNPAALRQHSININAASKGELMQLPGIGEEYAERIIDYRKAHGPFSGARALIKVKGIGRQRLERLLPYITTDVPDH